jgi:tRNA (guanine37-N1)-methyltransferase
MLSLHFITCFENELDSFISKGIIKQARAKGLLDIKFYNLRNYGVGTHKKIDDYPFSNKKGMLLRADVVYNAVTSIEDYQNMRIIYTCPKGFGWNQDLSTQMINSQKEIILISGYYEGIDHRIFDLLPIEPVSIGDYIVNNGDCAVAVIAETLIRQVPGVLGNSDCIDDDSHCSGMLETHQFTQPLTVLGLTVPEVLLSGNHKAVALFKQKSALKDTLIIRSDLIGKLKLSDQQQKLMTEILKDMVVKKNDK